MASSINEQQVLWSTASSTTVSSSTAVVSDAITFHVEDWSGSVEVSVDNTGTPASGDICDVAVAWSNGDVLGDSGDDFDTTEHAQLYGALGRLDTYGSNTPGEDPARATFDLDLSGKKACKIIVSCPQAASRNITVRARIVTHRPQ